MKFAQSRWAPGGGSRFRRLSAPAPSSSRACAGAHGVLGAVRPRERRCSGPGTIAMPGMMLFGRRWAIASDDLVFPGFCELLLRVLWWVGILALYVLHGGQLDCVGGGLLTSYLVVLLVLLAVVIGNLLAIVSVSMRGTICNPRPRMAMPKLLYFRLALFVPEMIWAALGAAWVANNVHCDRTVVGGILATVVVSWIIIAITVAIIVIAFDPLGGKPVAHSSVSPSPLDSHEANQVLMGLKTAAASVWERRMKLLCCCVGHDDHVRGAFTSTGELLSTFFSDTDLVPSDIAAGLALLHQQQDSLRDRQGPVEVISHSLEAPQEAKLDTKLDAELDNCHHYMQFAAAAYGWPLYVYRNPLTGLCRVGGDCCRAQVPEDDLVGGEHLHCHLGSILQSTGLHYRDFIHISFHDKVYEIPFLVALDHRKEAVVVAVRGTMSMQDILTDLSAESEALELDCGVQDCSAHKGISQAAKYLHRRLVNDGILSQAFSIAPEYKLVIVGHSLGAGAAAILTLFLRGTYPQVRCYAFSPPRGLFSKALHEHSQSFMVSLILGKDVIPRLSITNLEDLKQRILRVIANCSKPKYQILLHGCWYELFGGTPTDFPTELEGGQQCDLTRPLLGEQSLLAHGSPSYSGSGDSLLESPSKYPPLYPPGRIIHLEEEGTPTRLCCSAAHYSARWAHEAEFSKILIGPKMLTDHMPDVLLRALDRVVSDRGSCVSCPAPEHSV